MRTLSDNGDTWYEKLFAILEEYFDRDSCYQHVMNIHNTDRWFDFKHFSETAQYCAQQMRLSGLAEVELLPLKADGHTAYGDWVVPRAWDVSGAVLKVTEDKSDGMILADYSKTPCSLMMYSAPTPEGGIDAEVVVLDELREVDTGEYKGKLILTSLAPGDLIATAVKSGAAGIVSDFIPLFPGVRADRRSAETAYRWENVFIYPINATGLFGFSLSPQMGDYLRNLISAASSQGRYISLHADVAARFYDGIVNTVSGVIPGTDPQGGEVMLCGHLYEPGANDNASGCGLILELATALQKAISEGKLLRPKRSIRFVMGFEVIGLMGYIVSHPDRIARTIGAVNTDMVGAADVDRATLKLWHNPLSNWSFLDTLLPFAAGLYRDFCKESFNYMERGFAIGDNIAADPMFGVPTVGMVMHPAASYHSSLDTMERIDRATLRRNAVIAGTVAMFMAQPDVSAVRAMLPEILPHALRLVKASCNAAAADLIVKAFKKGCLSLKKLLGAEDSKLFSEIDSLAAELAKLETAEKPGCIGSKESMLIGRGIGMVPSRKVKGTLTLDSLDQEFREKEKWRPFYDYNSNCALFWADGKRDIYEIACLTAAELCREDIDNVLADLMEYFEFLEGAGLLEINSKSNGDAPEQ